VKNLPRKLNTKTGTTVLMVTSTGGSFTGLLWAMGMLEDIQNAILVVRRKDEEYVVDLCAGIGAIESPNIWLQVRLLQKQVLNTSSDGDAVDDIDTHYRYEPINPTHHPRPSVQPAHNIRRKKIRERHT
jgi:hypothetical protein